MLNNIVGNLEKSAKIDLMANIILDISPPDATFLNEPKLVPLLAENKSSNSSFPLERNEFEVINSILNCESGIPNSCKIEEILEIKTGIAFPLFCDSRFAII